MILTGPLAIQKTIEMFLNAHQEYVAEVTKKGKLIIEVSQRFVDGKYQVKINDSVEEKKLKRIPVNVQSIIRQKHS